MCGTKGLVCRSGAILERCSAARLLEATLARHYAARPPPPRASRPRRSPQAVRPSPSPGRGRPARASTRWSPLRRSLHGYLQGGGDWHMRGFSTQLVIAGLVLDACCRRAQEEFGRCSACFARLARDVPCPRGPAKRRRGGGAPRIGRCPSRYWRIRYYWARAARFVFGEQVEKPPLSMGVPYADHCG